MKLSHNELANFFVNIPSNIKSVLIYGSDNGLVYERAKLLEKSLIKKHGEVTTVRYNFDELKNNFDNLYQSLNNLNFFSNFQLFIIEACPAKLSKDLELILEKITDNNFLILLADELSPSSTTRKFFETAKNAVIIPCYKDDARNIKLIAKKIFNDNKIKFSEDILDYIAQNLNGDRKYIISELEKLVTFIGDGGELDINDIKDCCSLSITASFDDFTSAVSDLNYEKSIDLFNELVAKGTQVISINRSLSNYFMKIFEAKSYIEAGIDQAMAVKKISPPIFVMHINNFNRHIKNFEIDELAKYIEILYKLEIKNKQTGAPVEIVSKQILHKIIHKEKDIFF